MSKPNKINRLYKKLRTVKKNIDYIEANNLMYSKRYFRLRNWHNELCDEISQLDDWANTEETCGLKKFEFVVKVERNVWVMI